MEVGGDLDVVEGGSVMNGYSAGVIDGEEGEEEVGMRALEGSSWESANESRFWSWEPRVV